jgi:ATP adenylyltransferase
VNASLVTGAGLRSGLLDESFGCGGLTLASELGQSQLSDVYRKEPASNGNFSTIAIAREQCQTQILRMLQPCFSVYAFPNIFPGGHSSANLRAMDYLWTPWRYAYVSGTEKSAGCVFCEAAKEKDDAKALIVYRGEHCFVILNAYPYTPGHVMVVPHTHVDELRRLSREEATEMIALSQRMETVLRDLYHPDGINLGMNIGKAAGAGIAGHIHMHVLPRWVADANFMSVVGETRVLPETLDVTWERMRKAMR